MVEWSSREHRKQAGRFDAGRGSTWWAPSAMGWWIGVLFAIGSICFTIGPFPGFVSLVGTDADAIVFFVGSIFFTKHAAFLQYEQTVNAPHALAAGSADRFRFWTWEPGRIDWTTSLVQLVGTVFFNVTTLAAIDTSLNATQAHRLVLGAGHGRLGVLPRGQRLRVVRGEPRVVVVAPAEPAWRIAGLNLAGSIAFGVSSRTRRRP